MSAYPVRRVAAMHDLSCFGRGSLTTILPVLSVLGVQVLPLPTTLLSTHTGGFEGFTFTDLTPELYKIADHWEKLGIRPDAIYTGFLSGAAQCDFIEDFITRFGGADMLTLIDPVMGDDGELYSQSTAALVDRMRELCRRADIIVPNLTEACLLCDVPYPDTAAMSPTALAACISALLDRLTALGPRRVVITGIVTDRASGVSTAGVDRSPASLDPAPFFVNLPRIGGMYPGTGDLFAAVLVGKLLTGTRFSAAVTAASAFVRDVIAYSAAFDTPHRDGVLLEPCLHKLAEI